MSWILLIYGVSLGLTLLIELPLCFALGMRSREQAELVVLTNLLTNPAAVWLHTSAGIPQIPVELLVVIIEYYVYRQFKQPHPLRLSIAANGISWGLGLVIQMM